MEKPVISVIMGVYNQWDEEVLLTAVNSILNQTFREFEFIIWDDGSHPDAARLVQKLSGLDSRIIIAGKEENRGLAFSLNECIKLARGKYIARMDADDISMPERFQKQYEFLETHPEYGWCGTSADLFDEEGVWGFRPMPEIPEMKDYFYYSPYVHPSVMFRAILFHENQGYIATQETLRCEDYEIFMNLLQRGQKGYNLQEGLFWYRETRASYRKRKFCFRINEAKTRYRNYKKMGKLFPIGWFYVLRPIAACLIPAAILAWIKRTEGIHSKHQRLKIQETPEVKKLEPSGRTSETIKKLPGYSAEKSGTFSGFG